MYVFGVSEVRRLANPKSARTQCPRPSSSTFSGLRSRYATAWTECRWNSAHAISEAQCLALSSSKRPHARR